MAGLQGDLSLSVDGLGSLKEGSYIFALVITVGLFSKVAEGGQVGQTSVRELRNIIVFNATISDQGISLMNEFLNFAEDFSDGVISTFNGVVKSFGSLGESDSINCAGFIISFHLQIHHVGCFADLEGYLSLLVNFLSISY